MSKKNRLLLLRVFLLLLSPAGAFAQKQYLDTIEVSSSLNTYLKIKGLDIKTINVAGTNNVSYQNVGGVIMFKASRGFFESTNMLVIASDTIFQFFLRYNPHPKRSLYQYSFVKAPVKTAPVQKEGAESAIPPTSQVEETDQIKPAYNAISFKELEETRFNLNAGQIKDRVMFRLPVIAQDKKNIYFLIKIMNNSAINYVIDNINFEVRSRKTMHTSGQQAVYPAYTESNENSGVVGPRKQNTLMYALNKFALRSDELLTITVFEKSTTSKGRQFKIDVDSSDFNSIITLK